MNKIATKIKLLFILLFSVSSLCAQEVSPKAKITIIQIKPDTGKKENSISNSNVDTASKPMVRVRHRFFLEPTFDGIGNVMISPPVIEPYYLMVNYNNGPVYQQQGNIDIRIASWNVLSLGIKARYNILQPYDNVSLALTGSVNATLIAITQPFDHYLGNYNPCTSFSFDFPAFAEFHLGKNATNLCKERFGLIAGVGYEYIAMVMGRKYQVPTYTDVNGNFVKANMITNWFEPCIEAGISIDPGGIGVNDNTLDIIGKFGFGPSARFIDVYGGEDINKSFALSITVIYYTFNTGGGTMRLK